MAHKTLVEVTTKTLVTVYANTANEANTLAKDIVSSGTIKPYDTYAVIQSIEEEEVDNLLVFSERQKLEYLFLDWCEENGAVNCPLNMVAFLQINKLIDEAAALEFVKNHSEGG